MHLLPPLALAFASLLASQPPTLISPAGAAANPGGGSSSMPFSSGPGVYQQVHNASSFSSQVPAVLTQMRFRHGVGNVSSAGPTLDVELYVARSPNEAASSSQVFVNNVIPGSEVNVFLRKTVTLPTVATNDWQIAFGLDAPLVWTSAHTSWRAVVWSSAGVSPVLLDHWREEVGGVQIGAGCAPLNSAVSRGSSLTTMGTTASNGVGGPGTRARFMGLLYAYTIPPPAFLTLGVSQSNWGGLALPFDLTPWGAPSCSIYNDAMVMVTGMSGASTLVGYVFEVSIPYQLPLIGQTFYAQMAIVDPAANPLGVTTSNGVAVTIPKPSQATSIYARIPNATTGTGVGGQYLAIGFN